MYRIILAVIILIGIFLRVVNISNNPPALYGDELTIILDAQSLLNSGKDQLGNLLPLTFQMGAGRPAGYVYGSIPFVALFGPTALGVRALSILSGIGLILLIYILARKLLSKKAGVVAALLMAISPWDLSLSRGGFEAHFALFLALLGVLTYILGKEKPYFLIVCALSLGFSLHTYPTYKLTLPIFLILLFYFAGFRWLFNHGRKIYVTIAFLTLVLATFLSLSQTIVGGAESRFWRENIFAQKDLREELIQKINTERALNTLPQVIRPIFHNKAVEYVLLLSENYLKNFAPDFLISYGDKNPRHNMAAMGGIYALQIILIFLGMYHLFKKNRKLLILLLGWVFVAPIPSALMIEPHFLRSAFMLPPLILLSAAGLIRPVSLQIIIFFGIFIQFLILTERMYFLSPAKYSSFWAYGAKQASLVALSSRQNYDYIVISSRMDNVEFAYPVYSKIDPKLVIEENRRKVMLSGFTFKKFDNVYIGTLPEPQIINFISELDGSVLYLASIWERKALEDYEEIIGKDSLPSFLIVRKE